MICLRSSSVFGIEFLSKPERKYLYTMITELRLVFKQSSISSNHICSSLKNCPPCILALQARMWFSTRNSNASLIVLNYPFSINLHFAILTITSRNSDLQSAFYGFPGIAFYPVVLEMKIRSISLMSKDLSLGSKRFIMLQMFEKSIHEMHE